MTFTPSDWTALFAALLPVIVGAVYTLARDVEAKLPHNVAPLVQDLVDEVVNGVEQTKLYQGLNGDQAKQLAMDAVAHQLKAWHISIPAVTLSTLIESAVRDLNETIYGHTQLANAPVNLPVVSMNPQPVNTNASAATATATSVTSQQPQTDSPTQQIAALNAAGDNAKV